MRPDDQLIKVGDGMFGEINNEDVLGSSSDWVTDVDFDEADYNMDEPGALTNGIGLLLGVGSTVGTGGLATVLKTGGIALSGTALAAELVSQPDSGSEEFSGDSYLYESGGVSTGQWAFEHHCYFSIFVPVGESYRIRFEDEYNVADSFARGEKLADDINLENWLENREHTSWTVEFPENSEGEPSNLPEIYSPPICGPSGCLNDHDDDGE